MIGSICSLESGYVFFFFFKQKTAYEMRISDWSSDVCSSDLSTRGQPVAPRPPRAAFLFETGPDGVIHWVDGVTRGTVIGLSNAEAAFGGEPGADGVAAGAFRQRAEIINARMLLEGTPRSERRREGKEGVEPCTCGVRP